MNEVADILTRCKSSGVSLIVEDGAIKARGPTDQVDALLPSIRQHKPDLIRALTGRQTTDLNALALDIAIAHFLKLKDVLAVLDDDDRRAIITGSDPGRADAWRCAVALLVADGTIQPIQNPEHVTCGECQHRQTTRHPMLLRCELGNRAPGACGQWWATDRHVCAGFSERREGKPDSYLGVTLQAVAS